MIETRLPTRFSWTNAFFIFGLPLLTIPATALYVARQGFQLADGVSFGFMYLATGMAITAGYHRFYTHRTYECSRALQLFYLAMGAASLEHPVLRWASDHRYHHQHTDRDGDPYDIRRGFYWAHMGWILYDFEKGARTYENAPDLRADPWVVAQERHFELLLLVFGFGLPALIGALFGRPGGGLIWGGLVRLVLVHQSTFLINSAAHRFGRRPPEGTSSARDSGWLALFTFGEGHHGYHHAHPGDYRNGAGRTDWDPAKWWIWSLSRLGLAWGLRRPPALMARSP